MLCRPCVWWDSHTKRLTHARGRKPTDDFFARKEEGRGPVGPRRFHSCAMALLPIRIVVILILSLPCALVFISLIQDALRSPFSPISDEAQLQSLSRRRRPHASQAVAGAERTLHSLARASGASRLRITVTQSLDSSDAAAADATGALLKSLRLPFQSLKHLPQVRAPEARSYSTDAARYGTKRGSCRNLLHGLEAVFGATPSLTAALVIEDDVRLSADVFEFFDLAASIVAASHGSAHTAAAAGGGSGAPAASADAPPVALASAFATHATRTKTTRRAASCLAGCWREAPSTTATRGSIRSPSAPSRGSSHDQCTMRCALTFWMGSQPMLAPPDGAPLALVDGRLLLLRESVLRPLAGGGGARRAWSAPRGRARRPSSAAG